MTLFPVANPATSMRFMWLGSLGLLVTFLCLLTGRVSGSFPGFLLAGMIAGFGLDIYCAIGIARGQFKRIGELPPRFESWEQRQQTAAGAVRRTTTAGVVLVFVGVMVNFLSQLLGIRGIDPFWGLALLFVGMGIQLFGLARYLERLG